MSRVSINETTLTAIGDAIRGKTGKSELIAPGDMPAEITAIVSGGANPVIEELEITSNGTYNAYDGVDGFAPVVVNVPQEGGPDAADLVYTNRLDYLFQGGFFDWVIEKYGNQITTNNITRAQYTFQNSDVKEIPFALNFSSTEKSLDCNSIFFGCRSLTTVPEFNTTYAPINMTGMFNNMNSMKYFPEGWGEGWDWSNHETATSSYTGYMNSLFDGCYLLRAIPQEIISHGNPSLNSSSTIYYNGFRNCHNLEKINNLFVYNNASFSSNAFNTTFLQCERLKEITFKKQADGTPYVCNGWKKQLIDLTTVGYGLRAKSVANTDLTDDDKIENLEDYLAYVNGTGNPNGWAAESKWSVFNRKSMVKLIDSLPDVSGSGSTNTVKVNWGQGAPSTTGNDYYMNALSEEEIAVAAAKGWTITIS